MTAPMPRTAAPAPAPRRPLGASRLRRELGHALSARRRLVAAALAAAAVAFALSALRPAPPPTVRILAAADDLASGTRLGRSHLTTVELPAAAVPDGSLRTWRGAEGRVLATPMRRGEPLTDVRLAGPALLSRYGEDLVATPVRIADPGAARVLRPGDRVDVFAAASDEGGAAEEGGEGSSGDEQARPVAPAVAVVAVPRPDDDSFGLAGDGALVLLATTSEQAATLARAAVTSRLSVAIRPQ